MGIKDTISSKSVFFVGNSLIFSHIFYIYTNRHHCIMLLKKHINMFRVKTSCRRRYIPHEIPIYSVKLIQKSLISRGILPDMVDDSLRKEVGRMGEEVASKFLESKDFRIIARNYRKPWGEIDIIAEKGGVVRFVEVKAVSRESLPDVSREIDYRPEEMVDRRKLRKLARTAALYMEVKKDKREFQIDVVGVIMVMATRKARCRLFEQALEDNL